MEKTTDTTRKSVNPDLDTLAAQVEVLAELVASSSATVGTETPKKTASDLPIFQHNGVAYRFNVHGFSLDGTTTYNSAQVVEDDAMIEKIVTEYPGLISRIE